MATPVADVEIGDYLSQPVFVHKVDQRGQGGGAEFEFARVHLVDRILDRVVDVEIAL
jgi:hypothetical protein